MSQAGSASGGGGGGGSGINTLTGNTGGAVGPTAGNVNVLGGSNINTVGTPGTSTLTVNLDDTVSISGSMTAGTGFTATTGDVNILAGNLDLPFTNVGATQGAVTLGTFPFLCSDTSGSGVFAGLLAGNPSVAVGAGCVGIGQQALGSLNGGGGCVAIGYLALENFVGGSQNNAIGFEAMQLATSATSNNAMGAFALNNLTTGTFNIAIGDNAGTNYTSNESNNIVIGFDLGDTGDNGVIRIGAIGGGSPQTSCFIAGIFGNSPSSPQMVTINSSGQLGSQAIPGGGGISTLDGDSGSATGATVTIAGGAGISTSASGSTVTITATGSSAFTWSEITASTVSMLVNNGYILNNAGGVTATLPVTAAVGTTMRIAGKGSGGWTLAQNTGQSIQFESQVTTVSSGTITPETLPADQYAALELLCITADTVFEVISCVGNFTVS